MNAPENQILWYKNPALRLMETLPVGNGRLGALIYGGAAEETLILCESTCLSGEASDKNIQRNASQRIPQISEALFKQNYEQAHELAEGIKGLKNNYGTNLPFGRVKLAFDHGELDSGSYRRELCLNTGIAAIEYEAAHISYKREIFVSNPADLIVLRISTSEAHQLSFTFSLDGGENPFHTHTDAANDLLLAGNAYETLHSDGKTGVAYHARVRIVQQGGELTSSVNTLEVKHATSAVIYIALGTTFGGLNPVTACERQITAALNKGFEILRQEHEADYRNLFDRVEFQLGAEASDEVSTDERLKRNQIGKYDPSFTALMFHYGRYLLIASSRENSPLPAHLQGAWNDNEACRMGWTCDLHLDINTQMNYWPADVTNLAECNQPLVHWLESVIVPSGRKTARELYGHTGWVAHTVSNAWGFTAPGWDVRWGIEPFCGIWIASHLWETYRFTLDKNYLNDHAYPVIKEAAGFLLDYLVEDPRNGYLTPGPSFSPENAFLFEGNKYHLDMGITYAIVVARNLLQSCIEASMLLDLDGTLREAWQRTLDRLPPLQIGKYGQLQEWFFDFEEADSRHRHISHLLAVFPYGQIDPELTPELAEAAHVTLMRRLYSPNGYEETGWARCVALSIAARLWDGEEALRQIRAIERRLTEVNLLTFDPPVAGATTNVFELDGNTGLSAGIAELLLQSHQDGVLHLLPALPKAWKDGKVKGLCARGGFQVDIEWRAGKLVQALVFSKSGQPCKLRYENQVIQLDTQIGQAYSFPVNG